MRRTVFFDLDGTLYEMKGGSFNLSPLKKEIQKRAQMLLGTRLKKTARESSTILKDLISDYGEHLSVAFEEKYGISRSDYFSYTWDVPAAQFVEVDTSVTPAVRMIAERHDVVLLSDAPRVWIDRVLTALQLSDVFGDKIFSGEGALRKSYGNAFIPIVEKLGVVPRDCISVGDQMETDIIPAKKIGMQTVFVSRRKQEDCKADYCVANITDVSRIILGMASGT